MAIKPIQILINAKDNASGVFDSVGKKIAALGSLIASYFGIATFVGAVRGAADFERAISRVQAATGSTGDELERLKKAAEDAGASTKFTSTEAAAALENLAKAGLDANQAIETLPAVLALAQAGDVELAAASEYVTKAVMGMGLAFADAGRVADVLAKGANATNTSVEGLSQALSFAAPTANSLGVSLESTVAILGKFADAGIDASRAGTSLNNILSQFSDPASQFRRELAAAGITTVNFEQALHELAEAGPRGERSINAVGRAAGPALRALLNQGMGALDELTASLRDAEGSAAATAKVMENNLKGSMTGLGSAWDTVKNTLGAPVLPVLKEGVDKLAESFRSAVGSGLIEKFGQSLATMFKASIQWIEQFVGSFDWAGVAERMAGFADQAAAVFGRIGEYATNAGNVVKTAWGVMGAGIEALKSGIYAIGSAFSEVAAGLNRGVALIMEGLSKISFGGVSQRFAEMAANMRTEAGALGAVADALSESALKAMDASADHARAAADGFSALVGSAAAAGRAVASTAASFTGLGAAAKDAGDKATQAADKVKQSTQQQAAAAEEARASVAALRAEYAKAVETGNIQRAAEIMQQLKAATQAAAGSQKDLARQAAEAAARVASAFEAAGIKTRDDLAVMARTAREDFDLIKNSGQASAEGLATAWKRAADAAIAANNGIAPSWVQAEAAVHKYQIATDAAGRATVDAADATESSTGRMAAGWREVAQATREATAEAKLAQAEQRKYDEFMASRFERGMERNTEGRTVSMAEDPALRNQRLARLYGEDMIGNQNAEAAYNLNRRITLLERFSVGPGDGSLALLKQELERLTAAVERDRQALQEASGPARDGPRARSETAYVSNISIGSGPARQVRLADADSQNALERMLSDLTAARGVAS